MRAKLFLALTLSAVMAQAQTWDTFSDVASELSADGCFDLPVVRRINGGTVINVTYEGDWTYEMKGAFEYACKIMEEAMPPCVPINVTARIEAAKLNLNSQRISTVKGQRPCH